MPVRNNDDTKAKQALLLLHQIDRPTGLCWFTPTFVPLSETEIALKRKEFSAAINIIDRLLAYLEQTGTRTFVSDALSLKPQAQVEIGQDKEAWHNLLLVRQAAEAIGSRRPLWPVLVKMATICEVNGDHGKAVQLRPETREVLKYIFDQISSAELRNTFLNL